jgi:hypothetical protein
LVFTVGCGISTQVQQAVNLTNCDFRVISVENVDLAGVNVQNVNNLSQLNWTDAQKLMKAAASGTFPLNFQLNLEGRNPNTVSAGLNRLEYQLFIDEIQMTTGILNQSFTIPPTNGTTVIPINMNFDLKQVLSGKSIEAIVNFGLNLAGTGGKPTRIMIKLKPSILVNGKLLSYPGFLTVRTEYQ